MPPLELVEETLKGPSVTLKVDNQPSGPKKQNMAPPTLHRMKPTSRMTAIRSFKSGIDSLDLFAFRNTYSIILSGQSVSDA